jgi:predicted transcriptional regulator
MILLLLQNGKKKRKIMIVNVLVYSPLYVIAYMYMASGNNEENYDDDHDENNSYQPFRNIEQTLFEVANAERLSILLKLKEENNNKNNNNLSKLSKDLNIVVQEVHRHTNRLLKAGLVQKDSSTGYFSLTTFGNIVVMQLSALDFISKNRNYFSDHTLGDLPLKFIQRVGSLVNSQLLTSSVAVFEYQKELFSTSRNYICTILPEVPQYLIDSVMPTIEKGVRLRYILSYNAVLPKKRHGISKHEKFHTLINKEIVQRRMIDNIQVGLIINETQSMVSFSTVKSKTDMNSAFCSSDPIFHDWCLDYFNYKWENSKSFNPEKITEA